ncbi:Uncharacterised protein [Raoultella terrigena]|uniref:Uncharacterized protein n=1 Tax=Raoultella terrigena TaxID=577 RepID=A0A4U9CYW0_RAOTE|nr:Uncharacterised protein [Raoultella terrigena]
MALSLRIIPDIREEERRPFDLPGFLATSVAMVSLVSAMEILGDNRPEAGRPWRCWDWGSAACSSPCATSAAPPGLWYASMRCRSHIQGHHVRRLAVSRLHQRVPFLLPLLFPGGIRMDPFHSGLLVLAVFVGNFTIKTRHHAAYPLARLSPPAAD